MAQGLADIIPTGLFNTCILALRRTGWGKIRGL